MRKLVAIVLALACVLGLVSCANISDEVNTGGNIDIATENETPSADADTNPSETSNSVSVGTPSGAPLETPDTESPTTSSNPGSDADLTAFSQILLSNYTFGITTTNGDTGEVRTSLVMLDPNDETDKLLIDNYFDGLTDLTLQQCVIYVNNFTTVEAELLLIQTNSADDVATVKDILQARIDYMVGDGNGPGGAWYPQTTETWKNNSRIVTNGNYVMFVVHSKCDDIVTAFYDLF